MESTDTNETTSQESRDLTPARREDGRTSVERNEQYRFASNIPADKTIPEQEYANYVLEYDEEDAAFNGKIPDVLLDVPVIKVDRIDFELNDLRAKVNLYAKVLDLVELSVGVDAYLGRVKLVIEGVEAQALLKVRLDNVTAIIDRVLTTIDRNPRIIEKLVESVGSAARIYARARARPWRTSARAPASWSAKGLTRPSKTSVKAPVIWWVKGSTRRSRTSVKAPVPRCRTSARARVPQSRMSEKAPG